MENGYLSGLFALWTNEILASEYSSGCSEANAAWTWRADIATLSRSIQTPTGNPDVEQRR